MQLTVCVTELARRLADPAAVVLPVQTFATRLELVALRPSPTLPQPWSLSKSRPPVVLQA
jgi:hypothetical protein